MVEVLVYAAAIGGQSTDYLAYLSFLRDKKWGRSHLTIACEAEMQATAERVDHPARLWVRAALIDTVVSFAMVVLIAGCFAIMGTVLLRPAQMVPDGVNLLNYQASFLTVLAPWLMPLYKIAVFFAFFGILYGGRSWPIELSTSTWRPYPDGQAESIRGKCELWWCVIFCWVVWQFCGRAAFFLTWI